MRSRADIHKIAAAPDFTARSMIAGARMYSLNRSAQVTLTSLCTRRIAPFVRLPAAANSSAPPPPASTRSASIPPGGVAGDQPSATRCTGSGIGERTSRRVSPSAHVTGIVYFSVCTSTLAARNAAMPHSTARFIAGAPVTRPPTSSVRRRKLLSRGDAPITIGKIFSTACSHDDGCVVEQPGVPCGAWSGFRGFGLAGGSCAAAEDERTSAQTSGEKQRNARRRILVAPWVKKSDQVIFHRRNAARIIAQPAGSRFRREARVQNAVGYAGHLRHSRDVVDPYDVRASENARRDRSGRAPNAVFRRSAASVARKRRAQKCLARSSHQQRAIEPG